VYLTTPHARDPRLAVVTRTHALSDEGSGDRTVCGRQLKAATTWHAHDAREVEELVTCSQCRKGLDL
jgi:hypothetical protein